MAVPQISAYLPVEIFDRFQEYAAQIGLKDSELAKLLILRELRIQRIATAPQPKKLNIGHKSKKKITAHVTPVREVRAFIKLAKDSGISRSQAAGFLITMELKERWLEKALQREEDPIL